MVDSNHWNNPMMGSGDYINAERDKKGATVSKELEKFLNPKNCGNTRIKINEHDDHVTLIMQYDVDRKTIEEYGYRYIGKDTMAMKNGDIRLFDIEYHGEYLTLIDEDGFGFSGIVYKERFFELWEKIKLD